MFDKIKYFARHSLVYGISNIAQKASGIILIPIYTKYLSTSEFGQLGILIVTIAILSQVLLLGQGQSLIRYSNVEEYSGKKNSVFFTLMLLTITVLVVFVFVSELIITNFSSIFEESGLFYKYLNLSLFIIVFTTLNTFLINKLRSDEKSTLYTISGVSKLLVILGVSVYLVAFAGMGVEGILISNLTGEIIALLIVVPYATKHIELKIDRKVLRASLIFGFPLIFSGLAMNLLNLSDRYILKLLTAYSTLGLYELAYKVAGILNMFLILPFSMTLLPIAYKMYQKEGDKDFYRSILTLWSFILFWAGLALSLFAEEIVHLFAQSPEYYPSYEVIPVLNLANVFFGISLVTTLGLYLTGNTKQVAVITLFCAAINIVLNLVFVPEYGLMAAAVNTVVAFLLLIIFTTIYSGKYYKVPYSFFRIGKIMSAALILYFIPSFFHGYAIFSSTIIIVKISAILLFPFTLFLFKFYNKAEIAQIKHLIGEYLPQK